jgi:hypothetical protein
MNKYRGEEIVKIGGADKLLRFGNNEICELENLLGKPIHEILAGLRVSYVRASIYIGLKYANKMNRSYSLDYIGDGMDMSLLSDYIKAVGRALVSAMGQDPDIIDKAFDEEDEGHPLADGGAKNPNESIGENSSGTQP